MRCQTACTQQKSVLAYCYEKRKHGPGQPNALSYVLHICVRRIDVWQGEAIAFGQFRKKSQEPIVSRLVFLLRKEN